MTQQTETATAARTGMQSVAAVPVLASALERLSSSQVDGLSEVDLLQLISLLEATKGAAAALQARATARFVEGRDAGVAKASVREQVSRREASIRRSATRAEVALARRCSPGQADRHVGVAQALVHDLPHTMRALTEGAIGEWRATIVVRETACLSRLHRLEADRRLSGDLMTLGDRALAAAAHRACVDLDQEAVVERRRRAAASRHVSARPAPDGMAWLTILGPVVDVVGAFAALRTVEQARHVATGDLQIDAARAADERGRGAWMADTALELLSGRREGQVQQVEIGLVMGQSTVVPRSGGGGDAVEVLGFGSMPGPSAREHLLRLCDDETGTWLRRLWTSPDGRDLVSMESRQRVYAGGLRRLIELRDATCRVPWCDAPARQVDHVLPAARGGQTSAANAMGTCQRHNLVKEAPGWRAEVVSTGLDPGGGPHEVQLTTPTGSDYHCVAPPLLGHGHAARGLPSAIEVYYDGWLSAA